MDLNAYYIQKIMLLKKKLIAETIQLPREHKEKVFITLSLSPNTQSARQQA